MFCILKICRYTHRRIARERERGGGYAIYTHKKKCMLLFCFRSSFFIDLWWNRSKPLIACGAIGGCMVFLCIGRHSL